MIRINVGVRREIPPYVLVSDEGLDLVEQKSEEILQEIGIEFRGDEDALKLWRDAGADVKGERVRFDKGMVREHLKSSTPAALRWRFMSEYSAGEGIARWPRSSSQSHISYWIFSTRSSAT